MLISSSNTKIFLTLQLLLLVVSIADVFSTPITTTTTEQSLIISSPITTTTTFKPVEQTTITNGISDKGDTVPSVPKIYEMNVIANVSNRFATTLVTSKVKNVDQTTPQQATFAVILPDKAYISGFVMEIDGKSYKAYVKEKKEAKQIYEQAIQHGQAAAHVEANARDSNRFTVSVNVEPQSKATFHLTYEELLQRHNDQYEIILNIHPEQPVKDMHVAVHINETRPLNFVKAPPLRTGNEIGKKDDDNLDPQADIVTVNATSAIVTFKPTVERQKQLASALGTDVENGLNGQFVVQYDVERDPHGGEVLVKDGYFVHFFAPNNLSALPKHVVFVLDTSGSMEGIRIQQLKTAMKNILSELKNQDKFNIVEFNSIVKVWNVDDVKVQYTLGGTPWHLYMPSLDTDDTVKKNQTLPAASAVTEETIKKAIQVVEQLNAFGGTDIEKGLKVALDLIKNSKSLNHQPIVVFLTDGEPTVGITNTNEIIASISDSNAGEFKSPIFSLSFGDGADREFLQKLSLKNLGFARHIYEGADASLQLEEFYQQISSPLLNNVEFKYVLSNTTTKVTQTKFPIFFSGSELVVAGEISDPNDRDFNVPMVTCWGAHGPIHLVPNIAHPIGALERHWAYLTVKQVLEVRDAAENKTAPTKKALDLALKYSFVTPVSSLVVVKPNDTSAVNTEDASNRDRPYFSTKSSQFQKIGYPTVAFSSNVRRPAFSSGSGAHAPLYGVSAYSFVAPMPEMDLAFDTMDSTTLHVEKLVSTDVDKVEYKLDSLESLNISLPWLNSILNENGTLSQPAGDYYLGLNDTIAGGECLKTPLNSTDTGGNAGRCSLIKDCPEIHALLTDIAEFLKYFCPLDRFAGICCPKH